MEFEKINFRAPHLAAFAFCLTLAFLSGAINAAPPPPWQAPLIFATLASIFAIAAAYILVHIFHAEQLNGLIKDEIGQLALTIFFVLLIVGAFEIAEYWTVEFSCQAGSLNGDSSFCKNEPRLLSCQYLHYEQSVPVCNAGIMKPLGATSGSILTGWAQKLIEQRSELAGNKNEIDPLVRGLEQKVSDLLGNVVGYNSEMGKTSAKSGYVYMINVGASVPGCSAFGILRGPMGQLINAMGLGLMELDSMKLLMSLNTMSPFGAGGLQFPLLSLFLPLGIILRTLQVTRKAGNGLIALSLSLYFVFPSAFIIGQAFVDGFLKANPNMDDEYVNANGKDVQKLGLDVGSIKNACDPMSPDENGLIDVIKAPNSGLFMPSQGTPDDEKIIDPKGQAPTLNVQKPSFIFYPSITDRMMFLVLVRLTIVILFSLMASLVAVRGIGAALETEIDVYQLARLS